MTPNILGDSPSGFSDPLKQSALEIRTRIQSGETIPLAELAAFILSAEKDLDKARIKRAQPEKKTDVDFF